MDIFGLLNLGLTCLIALIAIYVFWAYTSYRIGMKFGIGTFGGYCIPIYNMVLLCRCADISGWFVLGVIVPSLCASLVQMGNAQSFAMMFIYVFFQIISFGFAVYMNGKLAERLGRNFWLYGFGNIFFWIPFFILAYGNSRPVHEVKNEPRPQPLPVPIQPPPDKSKLPIHENRHSSPLGLYSYKGQYAGNFLELPSEGLTIGRDPARANLVFKSDDVSRVNTFVLPDALHDCAVLHDLDSTNGTYYQSPDDSSQGWQWAKVQGSIRIPRIGLNRFRIGDGIAEFEIR